MVGCCICGKAYAGLMLVTEGTCLWCGHGTPPDPISAHQRRRAASGAPLPRDLGSLQREGRRLSIVFANVVHLDRLRRPRKMRRAA